MVKNILITRNPERITEIVETLADSEFKPFFEPLFTIEKIKPIKNFAGKKDFFVILTSINAIDGLLDSALPRDIKIYVVGKKTAQNLQKHGFSNIFISEENSALSLKDLILKKEKLNSAIYFCGSIVTLDFAQELAKFGFKVENILSYKTHEMTEFSAGFLKFCQSNNFDYVTIFSRNNAQIFFKLAKKHNLLEYFNESQILCFSEKILLEIKEFGFKNSVIFSDFSIFKNFYD